MRGILFCQLTEANAQIERFWEPAEGFVLSIDRMHLSGGADISANIQHRVVVGPW
jgi:hypothetical protein